MSRSVAVAIAAAVLSGCGRQEPAPTPEPAPETPRDATPGPPPTAAQPTLPELPGAVAIDDLPHLRIDAAGRLVAAEGVVPIDAYASDRAEIYLEVIACAVGTRDHEALLATRARPSHLHAALLLVGLTPGRPGAVVADEDTPGGYRFEPPAGDPVRVSLLYAGPNGEPIEQPVDRWLLDPRQIAGGTGAPAPMGSTAGEALRWVFAGSSIDGPPDGWSDEFVWRPYAADRSGTLVGLATFGDEPVAPTRVRSPELAIQPAYWRARRGAVPPAGTPVWLIIRAAEPAPAERTEPGR